LFDGAIEAAPFEFTPTYTPSETVTSEA
jgi:hypothetical protein